MEDTLDLETDGALRTLRWSLIQFAVKKVTAEDYQPLNIKDLEEIHEIALAAGNGHGLLTATIFAKTLLSFPTLWKYEYLLLNSSDNARKKLYASDKSILRQA